MAKNESYWVGRADERMALAHKGSDKTIQEINSAYDASIKSINEDMKKVFNNLANLEDMDKAQALELLNERVSKKTLDDIRVKINLIEDEKIKRQLMNKLSAQAYKARLTKLQALKESIYINSKRIADVELRKSANMYFNTIKDTYYRNIFDSQKAFGYVFDFAKIPDKQIEEILKNNWSGKHYSSRIWDNSEVFAQKLEEIITSRIMSGKSSRRMAKELAEYANVGKFVSERLIRTETTYIVSMADLEGSKARGTKQLKFTATLDSRTSSTCRQHDGMIVDVEKAAPGENIPPLHCYCRSVMIDVIEGLEHKTRLARDPVSGKNYKVPSDIKYEDWHKQFVEVNPDAVIAEKKKNNFTADKKQYEDYKNILGKEYAPDTIENFQNVKYGSSDEYGILKAQAKGMSYYNKTLLNEPEITKQVKKVAEMSNMGIAGIDHRIKDKDTYLEKIRRKYKPGNNEYEIKDIIRYTYAADPEELAYKMLKSIDIHENMGYNTVEITNSWLDDINPYNGINTIVKAPNGQKFELQYHTPESFELKNGEMHKLYEKQRIIKDTSSTEYIELTDQMFELSDKLKVPKNIGAVRNK